jgi:hypothetical protein
MLLLILACFPLIMEAAACEARQYAGTGGITKSSPQSAFAHLRESILFQSTKEKQLFLWLAEKRVTAE